MRFALKAGSSALSVISIIVGIVVLSYTRTETEEKKKQDMLIAGIVLVIIGCICTGIGAKRMTSIF